MPLSLNLSVTWACFGACHLTLKGLVDTRTPVEVALKEVRSHQTGRKDIIPKCDHVIKKLVVLRADTG